MVKTCSLLTRSVSWSPLTLSLSLSHTHWGLAPGCSSLGELSLLSMSFSFFILLLHIYIYIYLQATTHDSEILCSDVKPGCERLGKVSV